MLKVATALPHEPYREYKDVERVYSNSTEIDKILDKNGNVLFAVNKEVEGTPALTYKGKEETNLKNYRIYGNTVGGESVGDLVESGEHAGEYKVAVKVEGKNLCNNIWEQKAINVDTGNASPNWSTVCCNFIPVKPNVTYSCSRTIANNYNNLRCYGTNKNYLGTGADLANKANPLKQGELFGTFMITDARVSYIRFDDASNSLDTKYMLVEGIYTAETMPPYEPYYEPVTANLYLPEPIKMVGDEAEYIDYAEQKIHRVRKNLLENTAKSQTIKGVTFTVNSDGSVTCNGTASATTFFTILMTINQGVYTVSGAPGGCNLETPYVTIRLRTPSGGGDVPPFNNNDFGIGVTISSNKKNNNDYLYKIRVPVGYTCNNLTFYPMIRKADIEDDTYEPYIKDTELDVTLPALPTISGTNTLTVGTEVQPSNIHLKGRIKEIT